MFRASIIGIVYNAITGNYNYLKLNTKAIAKEVEKLLKDNHFMLSSPVSTLPFTMPN